MAIIAPGEQQTAPCSHPHPPRWGTPASLDSIHVCEGYECVNDAGTIRRDEFYDETHWFIVGIDRKSCIMFHTRKTSRVRVAPYVGP